MVWHYLQYLRMQYFRCILSHQRSKRRLIYIHQDGINTLYAMHYIIEILWAGTTWSHTRRHGDDIMPRNMKYLLCDDKFYSYAMRVDVHIKHRHPNLKTNKWSWHRIVGLKGYGKSNVEEIQKIQIIEENLTENINSMFVDKQRI